MLYTSDIPTIQKCLVDRVAIEQKLALDLSAEFSTGELHRRLQAAVRNSFEFLVTCGQSNRVIADKIAELERNNAFLFHTNVKTVVGVLAETAPLTPEQCGNLIRFYGEVIDSCSTLTASFSAERARYFLDERAKQIGWRYGGGGEAFKASRDPSYVAKADKGMVWQKTPTKKGTSWQSTPDGAWTKVASTAEVGGGRIRVKAGNFFGGGGGTANPYYDLIPGNLFQNDTLRNLHVGKRFGGVMVWKIEDTSTIGKIDRTFGLPYGADISGTTTDNLYFLTGWADISSGDPLLMMLPLAAIVGEYHHSLLEVAAAMTLRKVISYSIGFYTTLLPTLPKGKTALDQRGAVQTILSAAENDPRNKHILIHYNRANQIAGCFLAEPGEYDLFKKLGTVDISMWPRFNGMNSYPQEDDIMRLLGEVGLVNAALSSRRGALRNGAAQAVSEAARLARHGLY
ncbi:MAG TPA: hypothetical protein VF555_16225 [Variovorax sp.]